MQSKIHFLELTPKSWEAAKLISKQLKYYSFRGQGDSKWGLATTLERLTVPSMVGDRERYILKAFKSRAHHYIQTPPTSQDNVEWLSIIQDYGGPTRLLDFTHSFYVAAFFALESTKEDACIWAISDLDLFFSSNSPDYTFIKPGKEYFLSTVEDYNSFAEAVILDEAKSIDLVIKIIPTRLNERLAVQKGFFLFNCNANKSFEYSLCKTFKLPFDSLEHKNATELIPSAFLKLPKPWLNEVWAPVKSLPTKQDANGNKSKERPQDLHVSIAPIIKIILSKKYRIEALQELDNMNINYASLFPGIEGFAKSMRLEVFLKNKDDVQFRFPPLNRPIP
jgi:hypothetical protein